MPYDENALAAEAWAARVGRSVWPDPSMVVRFSLFSSGVALAELVLAERMMPSEKRLLKAHESHARERRWHWS